MTLWHILTASSIPAACLAGARFARRRTVMEAAQAADTRVNGGYRTHCRLDDPGRTTLPTASVTAPWTPPPASRGPPRRACRPRSPAHQGAAADERGGVVFSRPCVRSSSATLRDRPGRRNTRSCRRAWPPRPSRLRVRSPLPASCPRTIVSVSPPPGYVSGMPAYAATPDRHRHAGHHLEGDPLLVEEERLFAAAIEEERVALLQPRHDPAVARLLGEQEADGILIGGLTGRPPDVDALGLARRQIEHPRVHRAVVNHHVGRLRDSAGHAP